MTRHKKKLFPGLSNIFRIQEKKCAQRLYFFFGCNLELVTVNFLAGRDQNFLASAGRRRISLAQSGCDINLIREKLRTIDWK